MSFLLLPPKGATIIKLVGLNLGALMGPQNPNHILLAGGCNPSQQERYAMPYINQSQMGRYAQYPYQTGPNPQ